MPTRRTAEDWTIDPSDEASELDLSPLSGRFAYGGSEVEVRIYRLRGANSGWTLEVIDQDCGSTVWSDTFESDQRAWRVFYAALETEGPKRFLTPKQGA